MPSPQIVFDLVEHFARNFDTYRNNLNETEVRVQFIDPFFEALGWDIHNKQRYAETYKDVIHEYGLKTGAHMEAPDYCFQVGGTRKFFLEAKRPAIRISSDQASAFQLRSYAWSSKLPLSLLTNFAELAVYDCRKQPKPGDKASVARIDLIPFDQYPERWDDLVDRFSKEAVYKGSFDRYTESSKLKKGTAEVDDAFLAEIEQWRKELASNIAARNPSLSQREVNFAVQRTIDRIIFLRICEDRGIEKYGQLQDLQRGDHIYQRLVTIYERADEKYNSGLFHFTKERGRIEAPDYLTPSLKIDDSRLRVILKRIYYPESPYQFSHLPADILGQVYEQFLGQVIRLTPSRQVRIEAKPDVKKAGGVFYTPTQVVDYIVTQVLGELVSQKTPKEAAKLRIVDPACGSGSFLLGVYQYLLNWHLNWYIADGPEKHKNALRRGVRGEWRLTTSEKKRILLNNIYGVDIDSQAVEVTKLSLLLKVLEGENDETLGANLRLFHERALPDLGANIKCGNSLINSQFYRHHQMKLIDEEERYRINVFDWNDDVGFSAIARAGGFDAVIGNPPYGATLSSEEQEYLIEAFPEARKFPDSYCLFMTQAFSLAKKTTGRVSFIVPNTFCDLENCDEFRNWLLSEATITDIWQSGWAFQTAIVDTLVFSSQCMRPPKDAVVQIKIDGCEYQRSIQSFKGQSLSKIDYRNTEADRKLLEKISTNPPLSEFATVNAGVKMYEVGKGTPAQTEETKASRPYSILGRCPPGWRPLLRGEDIQRYALVFGREFVNYGQWLAAPRDPELFKSPKILMRRTDDRLLSCIDFESAICVNSCHVIKIHRGTAPFDYRYLLGLLNSSLLQSVFELQNPQMVRKIFAEIKVVYVERLPIHVCTGNAEKIIHDSIADLVDTAISLTKSIAASKTDHENTVLRRQRDAVDRSIDELVFKLYGLTDAEVEAVVARRRPMPLEPTLVQPVESSSEID